MNRLAEKREEIALRKKNIDMDVKSNLVGIHRGKPKKDSRYKLLKVD